MLAIVNSPLTRGDRINPFKQSQCHDYQCPGSLRRQGISTHVIDYVE